MPRPPYEPTTPPEAPAPASATRPLQESPLEPHLLPMTAEVGPEDRLFVGGVDVLDLVAEYGTPLFVYDELHLRTRCQEAVRAFGEGVAYATKAFLCTAMAALGHEEGMWLDVSTGGELYTALHAGVPAGRLILHGNNKSDAELAHGIGAGIGRVVVDSFDELDRIERLVSGDPDAARRRPLPLLIRVTPGIEAHTHEFVRTGQEDTKFGLSLASGAAAEAVRRARRIRGVELVGLHAHIGSQIFEVSSLATAAEILAELFVPTGLSELCIGGGLGVPYVNGERAPSLTDWAQAAHDACTRAGLPAGVRVTAEPGRSIVAGAALTLYRVGTIKELPGIRTFVAVDGGMSDNPRPVLYGSGYEAFLPRATMAPRPLAARVVGKHCESGDVLVADARLPADLAVGDVLATPVTGAYGYSMASNYNRVSRPPVLFVRDGAARVVIRGETLEDLVRLDR